jgi:predicted 2-oxoglutarate/Fe(II)-dependent dioxygenase YbiX
VAFRQFAVSINLNTGDYTGGELEFPEFGPDLYLPPAGAAAVFSASLLHAARPVLTGSRYVLLTFLHDRGAEERRVRASAQVG